MKRILSEDEFRVALEEECACIARGGYSACVAVFDVGEPGPRGADSHQLVAALTGALREIDVVGWTGEKQITVLLLGAGVDAARRVTARLAREVLPCVTEPSVSPLRNEPVFAVPRVGNRERARRLASEPSGRVQCDPAGVIGLLASPLPRWKRALDVAIAGAGLVLVLPLVLAIAFAIRATSSGNVLFRQQRTGHRLRRFSIYKFRSMRNGTERGLPTLQGLNQMSGPLFKTDADPRVTALGRLLRRTSLDELPQLVNVLRGDMTLLGPRALSPPPSAYEPWQLRRFTVTPGLACDWQATQRGRTDFEDWMRSDLRYVAGGPTLLGDLRLLARTVIAVLTCAGAR